MRSAHPARRGPPRSGPRRAGSSRSALRGAGGDAHPDPPQAGTVRSPPRSRRAWTTDSRTLAAACFRSSAPSRAGRKATSRPSTPPANGTTRPSSSVCRSCLRRTVPLARLDHSRGVWLRSAGQATGLVTSLTTCAPGNAARSLRGHGDPAASDTRTDDAPGVATVCESPRDCHFPGA